MTQIKNTIPPIIIYQIKHLGVSLRNIRDLYAENYTRLIKETKALTNAPIDWNSQYSQDAHFSEVVIWFYHIPIKIYNEILCSYGKEKFKIYMRS